jgi:adenosylcobinamide-GDP ribazoletransferase
VDAGVPRRGAGLIRSAWAEVSAAFGFLTRLRVGSPMAPRGTTAGAAAFGLVGGLLGVVAGGVVWLVAPIAPLAAGLLAVGVIAAISGALHIDGLADTADALAVGDPARAEAARRDPRIGPAGVVAVLVFVGLDGALIAAMVTDRGGTFAALACLVAASGSRAIAPALPLIARDRVRGGASAAWFAARTSPTAASVALTTAAGVAVIAELVAGSVALPVGLVAGIAIALVAAELVIRLRGALDGDGIGAMIEITFAATLLATAVAGSQGR